MSDVYAIDRDAAKKIIKASTDAPFVTKFLIISFPASRRRPAPWWDSQDIKMFNEEKSMYPDVAEAKLQADEYLVSRDDATGWFDLLRWSDEIEEAVDKVIRDRINCIESEDLDRMYRLAD